MSSLIAVLCGAQVVHTRNIAEGKAIPTKEEIAESYRCANTMINLLSSQTIELDRKAVAEEAAYGSDGDTRHCRPGNGYERW